MPALDGLRGVAALMVVLSHFSAAFGFIWFGNWLGNGAGQLGVMIFFVLSGFLMGHIYLPQAMTAGSVAVFFQRRIARVVPLFLAVLAVSFILVATVSDWRLQAYVIRWPDLIDYLTLQGYGPILWTISIELQFYLLFPLIWLIGRINVLLLVALVYIYMRYGQALGSNGLVHATDWRVFGSFGHCFLAGAAAAAIRPYAARLPRLIWEMIFIACAIGAVLVYPRIANAFFGWYEGLTAGPIASQMWASRNLIYLFALLILSASLSQIAVKMLGGQIGRWLGKISYSVYLLHLPIIGYFNRFTDLGQTPWLFFFVAIPVVLAVSTASYHYIERRARRWVSSLRLPDRPAEPRLTGPHGRP